jgi:hypothetical protein
LEKSGGSKIKGSVPFNPRGWAKSAASSAIATDIVPLGYKVTLDEGIYTVRLPKGMRKPLIKDVS